MEWADGCLQLRPLDSQLGQPVQVTLAGGKIGFRAQRAQHEMLVKAVMGRSKDKLSVLDATAGLGRDSMIMAASGLSVLALERHPLIYSLLTDAWDRAKTCAEIVDQPVDFAIQFGDAAVYMQNCTEQQRPDVIYLDPMFPENTRSTALVKKEMRIFRRIAGDDMDADDLLALALNVARKRVVVKRHRKAPVLAGRSPSHQVTGKSSRFDVYAVPAA